MQLLQVAQQQEPAAEVQAMATQTEQQDSENNDQNDDGEEE